MDAEVARLEAIKLVLAYRGTTLAHMSGGQYPYQVSKGLAEILDEAKRVSEFISKG